MTVNPTYPPFKTWQRRRRFNRATNVIVRVTVDMTAFNQACATAAEAIHQFGTAFRTIKVHPPYDWEQELSE